MFIRAQTRMFGEPTVIGDTSDKVTYILEKYPNTRNSYKMLMARYWLVFDGLDRLLRDDARQERFMDWFVAKATSPKTIQNRAGEIQNERPDLEASEQVAEWRGKQARKGLAR